jgi:hypothetical protein
MHLLNVHLQAMRWLIQCFFQSEKETRMRDLKPLMSNVTPLRASPAMVEYGPPEQVYVENEWYDGPRAGIADIHGLPHRFKSLFDEREDEYLGTFVVWPVDKSTVDLEIEQWCIFVEWNASYESGKAGPDSHPGHGGVNQRWDEIEVLLKDARSRIPTNAKRALADIQDIDRENRYEPSGPAYRLRWCVL